MKYLTQREAMQALLDGKKLNREGGNYNPIEFREGRGIVDCEGDAVKIHTSSNYTIHEEPYKKVVECSVDLGDSARGVLYDLLGIGVCSKGMDTFPTKVRITIEEID